MAETAVANPSGAGRGWAAWLLPPGLAGLGIVALALAAAGPAAISAGPAALARRAAAELPAVVPAWIEATAAGLGLAGAVFLVAVGLAVSAGVSRGVTLAQPAFALAGPAALAAVLGEAPAAVAAAAGGFVLAAALGAALVVGAAAGVVVDRVAWAPLQAAPPGRTAAAMLGVLVLALALSAAADLPPPPAAGPLAGAVVWQDASIARPAMAAAAAGLAAFVAIALGLRGSRTGRVLRAAAEDPAMTAALGHPLGRLTALAFAGGAGLAGLGGGLLALFPGGGPALPTLVAIVLGAVAVGGIGSVAGCLLGALCVGLAHGYAIALAPALAPLAPLAVSIACLTVRPAGLHPPPPEPPHDAPVTAPRAGAAPRAMVAVLFAALALAPLAWSGAGAAELAVRVCVFVLLAGSLDLSVGRAGLASLAHAIFFVIGGLAVALAGSWTGNDAAALAAGAGTGAAVAALTAVALGWLTLRAGAPVFTLISLGMATTMLGLAAALGTAHPVEVTLPAALRDDAVFARLPLPALPWPAPWLPGGGGVATEAGRIVVDGQAARYALVLGITAALYLAMTLLARGPRWRALATLGADPRGAAALGLSAPGLRLRVLAVSAAVAALTGALAAIWAGAATPAAGLELQFLALLLLAVLAGGAGTLHGPALAGAALALAGPGIAAIPEGWTARLPAAWLLEAPAAGPVTVGLALVVVALVLPRRRARG